MSSQWLAMRRRICGLSCEVAHLAVLEQPHQPVRVVLENVRVRREQAAVAGDEAVEFLAALAPEC